MKISTVAVLLACLSVAPLYGADDSPLTLQKSISLSGVTGKFDHFAVDEAGNRLFAAATGNQTVEVIDLATGRSVQSIPGFGKPHGLSWVSDTGRLFVADGSKAELDVLEGSPLKLIKRVSLSDDADDMVYDGATRLLYVGHGGSDAKNPAEIAIVDAKTLVLIKTIAVAAHPESLDLDTKRDRIFANISGKGEVVVIDGKTREIVERWTLQDEKGNTPMAYDAADDVLLIGCRTPAKLLALDARNGKELAAANADAGADDLFYEPGTHRAYLITGSGVVNSYAVAHDGKLQMLPSTVTAPGAKTGVLSLPQAVLFVGIPGSGGPAQIRSYRTSGR